VDLRIVTSSNRCYSEVHPSTMDGTLDKENIMPLPQPLEKNETLEIL
jgi:hypothetical protein